MTDRNLPKTPTEIVGNGDNVWRWADAFSREIHRREKVMDLRRRIDKRECGDCSLWMTKQCPREMSGGLSGFSRGAVLCGDAVLVLHRNGEHGFVARSVETRNWMLCGDRMTDQNDPRFYTGEEVALIRQQLKTANDLMREAAKKLGITLHPRILAAREKCKIIVDTEYTTWEGALESGWALPSQHREIVQIAAIKVDENFNEIASFDVLVIPKINPTLSDLFIELTGITQQMVTSNGLPMPDRLPQFVEFCGTHPVICMNADEAVFRENCQINDVAFPWNDSWNDSWHRLRPFLEQQGVDPTSVSSGDLHRLTSKPLTGHTHNALHDVRSMARWLQQAKEGGNLRGSRPVAHGSARQRPSIKRIKQCV